MTRVLISPHLIKKVKKKFKNNSKQIFRLMKKLEENPFTGNFVAQIGRIKIKELKYQNVFRLYFLTNEDLVKAMDDVDLKNLLIKFVEMSKKGKEQQEIINRLKEDLKKYGFDFF